MSRRPSEFEQQTEGGAGAAFPTWQAIQDYLESVRRKVLQEIEHYPPPIPACDVQFNTLLGQRDGLAEELKILEGVRRQRLPPEDEFRAAERFIYSSRFIDEDAAARLGAPAPQAKASQ